MGIFRMRRASRRGVFGSAAILLTASIVAGCGSTVSGNSTAGEIDVRKLEVGKYVTEPFDTRATYLHEVLAGKQLATGRLADAVVTGPDVDAMFGHSVLTDTLVDPFSSGVLARSVAPVLQNNKMMFAFSASASTHPLPDKFISQDFLIYHPLGGAEANPEATSFNVTVLQFPDQQLARTAAEQMEAADFGIAADQNVGVTLDKQPSVKAHWRPGIPSMSATMASGQYVVSVFVQQPKPELEGLKALVEKVFAAQNPFLERLPPLSDRDVLRLDYDPDGMLRRTLHTVDYADADADDEITRTPRGYLHYAGDETVWKRLLEDNGVDRISTARNGALLFRARDAAGATALWSGINGITPDSDDKPMGVPGVSCAENPKAKTTRSLKAWNQYSRFVCTLHYDRYVARVAGSQLADVHLRAAAQYALLANSQFM
ncbi:hypothetical protein ACFV4K_01185 [Nocardia sp. NPDC059764]|uniref:DUF7373 family lipoprotein n=1 Tax=Nocardia sp. NPDC059764 TaxID=3346939 RepID=UPI00365FF554